MDLVMTIEGLELISSDDVVITEFRLLLDIAVSVVLFSLLVLLATATVLFGKEFTDLSAADDVIKLDDDVIKLDDDTIGTESLPW